MAGATAYDAYDLRVMGPDGEFITLTSIKLDIPEYMNMEKGVLSRKWVDVKGSIVVKGETLQYFSAKAAESGSWQDMKPLDFISFDISPEGSDPLKVVLKDVHVMVSWPELKKLEGGAVEVELPILPGEVLINDTSVLRKTVSGGI